MRKLVLVPSQSQYSASAPDDVLYTKLDGGVGKLRLDQVGSAVPVRVSWTVSAPEYQYLMAFYRVVGHGSERFLVDLVFNGPLPEEHVAAFKPGTFSLAGVSGNSYQVRAELEAEPVAADPAADESVVDLYGEYGNGTAALLDALAHFANVGLAQPALVD